MHSVSMQLLWFHKIILVVCDLIFAVECHIICFAWVWFYLCEGPSYAVDTACSSSLLALDHALHALRSGLCDAAIVGGCSVCLRPSTAMQFQKLGMLAPDGACKSFDSSGMIHVVSE